MSHAGAGCADTRLDDSGDQQVGNTDQRTQVEQLAQRQLDSTIRESPDIPGNQASSGCLV
jgi:hypothetical protein